MRDPVPGLRRNRDFLLLWRGQSAARIGAEVTQLALPLLAVLTLNGSATQVAAVIAVEYVPTLLFGLVVGVWVDRTDRRRLLIASDLGRFLLLGAIPVLSAVSALTFPVLYLIVFAVGGLTLTYEIANQSLLPQVSRCCRRRWRCW
jgi:MFS family permease